MCLHVHVCVKSVCRCSACCLRGLWMIVSMPSYIVFLDAWCHGAWFLLSTCLCGMWPAHMFLCISACSRVCKKSFHHVCMSVHLLCLSPLLAQHCVCDVDLCVCLCACSVCVPLSAYLCSECRMRVCLSLDVCVSACLWVCMSALHSACLYACLHV